MAADPQLSVAGAGTMGQGIAFTAAVSGLAVAWFDPVPGATERGVRRLESDLERWTSSGRLTAEAAAAARSRLRVVPTLADLAGADCVIEAAPEDLAIKRDLFGELGRRAGRGVILATNTSSLEVAAIAEGVRWPDRVVGLHFFNPVSVMRLAEVAPGARTSRRTVDRTVALAGRLGKVPVVVRDTPGFIVNRVARPYYLEALEILAAGEAGVEEVDHAMRAAGFPQGPFELMDRIGVDINLAVSRAVHARMRLPRLRPNPIQARVVAAGRFGRKTGAGFYDYVDGRPAAAWAGIAALVDGAGPARPAAGSLSPTAGGPHPPAEIGDRIVACIVNEALRVVEEGTPPSSVDTAMRLGAGYPVGPIHRGLEIGFGEIAARLCRLHARRRDGRYRLSRLLLGLAASGDRLLDRLVDPAASPR